MKIPPLDLKRQYATIKKEVLAKINTVCDNQSFILGKTVADFEENMARYCGSRYAIGCASGTDAILLSLMVAGIGKGDEVIVPSFTFIASAEPIVRVGAKPIFCDIDPLTYNMDPHDVKKKITRKTKAIMVVHLYGQTADMNPIQKIARMHKLTIIEDACQAIGAVYGPLKKKAGNMGDFGCFSFFPSKNLGGFGDGGMIVTNSKKHDALLRMLRQHGSEKRYYHDILGMNSRLDALQAAVLDVKLTHLEKWLVGRIQKAAVYTTLFKKVCGEHVVTPCVEKNNRHTYHQYVIRIKNSGKKKRDALLSYLSEKGIGANVYYPVPCHRQKCFSFLKYKKGSLPVTEKAAHEVLALPIYPELTQAEQQTVVSHIADFLCKKKK